MSNTTKSCFCNICGNNKPFLNPRKALCPSCHGLERHRHLYAHLLGMIPFLGGKHFLHFAPETIFKNILSKVPNINYFDADITPGRATTSIDIKDIPFPNDSFDYVMAIHVLEHIDDDAKAMSEIYRVLKHGGTAILAVPFLNFLVNAPFLRIDGTAMSHLLKLNLDETFELPGKRTPDECFALYGQNDHVRIYGLKDFCNRLEKQNFTLKISDSESFPEEFKRRARLNGEVIIFAQKK